MAYNINGGTANQNDDMVLWSQVKNQPRIYPVTGIDGLVTGETTIVIPDADFIPVQAYVRLTALTGVATVGVIKIKDDTAGVDLFANTTLTGVTATGKVFPLILPASVIDIVPSGNTVKAEITTAYTVATVVTLAVYLIGFKV